MSNFIKNIEEIIQLADIELVVNRFVQLDKKGKACCPFHDEKTPSFSIHKKENMFKCFGCGKGGDSVNFVMEHEKLPYIDAVVIVAETCGVNIEREADYSTIEKEVVIFKTATDEQEEKSYTYEIKEVEDYELKELFPRYNAKLEKEVKAKYKAKFKALNFHALKSYTYVVNRKAITTNTHPQFPIFMIDHGDFKKLYKPREKNKGYRFLYIGTKPKDYMNGLLQLKKAHQAHNANLKSEMPQYDEEQQNDTIEEKLNEVIICSGERDSLNTYYMGYNVVWLNSETAELTTKQLIQLKKYAKKIYNLPDIDTTGLREGKKLAMQELDIYTIWLPEELNNKVDWRGKKCKDLTDYLQYFNKHDFKKLFENALPFKFWDEKPKFKKDGTFTHTDYEFNNVQAYNFLGHNGYVRYREDPDREDYLFVKHSNGVVNQISSNDVKMFIHTFLIDKMADIRLRNSMYKTNQLNDTSLSNLPFKKFEFKAHDKEYQYSFFGNKTLKISANKIEEIKFDDLEISVWKDKVLKHDISILHPMFEVSQNKDTDVYSLKIVNKESEFFQYIINTSRVHWEQENKPEGLDNMQKKDHELHIINKMYCIGYLLHQYKDSSKPWAVFAMDNKISEDGESNGGSGKSILFNLAIRKMLRSFYVSGRNKKIVDNPHIFEGVSVDTDYIVVDDCDRYLRFDYFFNLITGDFPVNPKGKTPYVIDFESSPKLAFTSNYTPDKSDGSTQRRILYTVFSDWYHDNTNEEYESTRTPKDDFKGSLFKDWDQQQWNLFYNFMIQCIQLYMKLPKFNPPMDNITKRNLLQQMGDAFKSWADMYIAQNLNVEIDRSEAYDHFILNTKLTKWTIHRFIKSVKSYCVYENLTYNPHSVAPSGRIIHKVDGKTHEYMYIMGENSSETEIKVEF